MKSLVDSGSRKRKDLKLEINKKQHLFSDYCYFYKKNRITVKKKKNFQQKLSYLKHKKPYLKLPLKKNDFDLLGAIKDVDLIASEFKKHKSC